MLSMESVNRTLKNALQIIEILQGICDNRRMYLEMQDSIEFQAFIKDWKQKQKKLGKLSSKEVNPKHGKKHEVEEKELADGMEELALVNSLLQKARSIRMKNKELTKYIGDPASKPLIESINSISKSSVHESLQKSDIWNSIEVSNKKTLPRSKSALPSTRLKTVVVPRSKSANVNFMPKEEKILKNHRISAKTNVKKSGISFTSKQSDDKISDESNAIIVSKKELQEFKKSYVFHEFSDNQTEENSDFNKHSSSDFSQDSCTNSFPTYRRFQIEQKRISSLRTGFQLHRGGLWYPFLSPKHRNYLLCQKKLTSFSSLTSTLKLIHKIQEAVVWIDLLSLVGRNALTNLFVLDANDLNVLRLCSYLESLYHENLQKPPLLDLN